MKKSITNNNSNPLYIQLYDHLKNDIVNGIYPYGHRLPSKRVMAEEMKVSIITVKHAYELLCDEGYVESRERSGYFVSFREDDGFVRSEKEMLPYAHQGFMMTELSFPFSVLAKTMRRILTDYEEQVFEKSPNKGCVELRDEIRKYLGRNRSVYADIEQIIVGSGAEYLYNLIVGLFENDTVFALEDPSYEKIERVYKAAGVYVEKLPLGESGIESDALTSTNADILHVSPYRSFPSGITATASKKHEYIRWAKQADRYIIEDDFESEFSVSRKPEDTMFALSDQDNVIYMNTFSKTISGSLRVGYMVLPKQLVQRFDDKLGFYSCTVPTYEQLLIAELIRNGDFERHINRVRRKKRRESR
ncbi:MAG: PLP-dependent aminotransferase family protein [Lachnospiraceae bacterium]|jgi:GntR family transcriptional regulator/MocR family aminotransferase|nr:PLP-dependent aminotransferase family protein [Lachnospiraceae bacterium]